MSVEIPVAFVDQFKSNVYVLAQQKKSKLREWVRVQDLVGRSHSFERIGPTEMVQKTVRHADTPLVSTPHSRRRVTPLDWEWADLVDVQDKVRLLIDPESEYTQNAARASGRRWDRDIISAALGNAFSIDAADASTPVALPSLQLIVDGGTGLTMAKVRQAKFLFDDVDVDEDDRVFVASPKGMQQLLTDSTVTSSDFNTIKALIDGTIADRRWMGFSWVVSSLLPKTANIRTNIAWQKNAMGMAINQDMTSHIDVRPDKSYATQVYISQTFGVTRIEEAGVVSVAIDESV